MVLYICEKYHNIWNGFQLIEQTRVNGRNGYVQCSITPKVDKSEFRLMCSACCLIKLYICVRFMKNISDSIRVMKGI